MSPRQQTCETSYDPAVRSFAACSCGNRSRLKSAQAGCAVHRLVRRTFWLCFGAFDPVLSCVMHSGLASKCSYKPGPASVSPQGVKQNMCESRPKTNLLGAPIAWQDSSSQASSEDAIAKSDQTFSGNAGSQAFIGPFGFRASGFRTSQTRSTSL